ncbi:MAG: tetratricopeptide repeat protein [Bacteroidales bacterium]|nr:tetratricopeptide repeat protein [Bacteroidales bacterium]
MANTQNEEQQGQLDQVEMDLQIGKAEQFVETNQNTIFIVLGAVILIIIGIWGYNKYVKAPKEVNAAAQMHMAELYFENDSINLALNGDGNYPGFLNIIDNYSSTDAANNAKFYAAACYMRLGQFDQAIKMLGDFSTSDPMLEPESIGLMGDAYMEKGETAKAVDLYKKAADKAKGNNLLAPIFLKKLGTAFEKDQKWEDALKIYETIKKDYPTSNEGALADKFIQAMKIKLGK